MKARKCDFINLTAVCFFFQRSANGISLKYALCILLLCTSLIAQSKVLKNLAPEIIVSGPLTPFTSCAGTVSASQSFAVSGSALTADINVAAPSGYELSLDPQGTFSASISLPQAAGIVNSTPIYVRLNSAAVQGTGGFIVCTSTGASDQNIATGNATVNAVPTSTPDISPLLQCTGFTNYFNGPSARTDNKAFSFSESSYGTRNLLYNGTDNLTIEIWAKWDGTIVGSQTVLFYNGHTGNGGYGIVMRSGFDGTLEILLGGKSFLTSTAKLNPGIWQHIAAVRSSGTWSLYLDGIQHSVSSNTMNPGSPSATAGNKTSVGSAESNNHKFYGSLDEVKFWTIARTTGQIQADMKESIASPTAGLLAYWNFDEGSGTSATDGSGNGNSLNLTGTSWTSSGAPTGATYLWDFGDGSNASTAGATHVYNTAGTKTVTLTVTALNGCTSTSSTQLTVYQSPTASITGTAESCATPITLTASGGISYQWSGGNSPNTATNTFNTSGYYTVTVTNASGCTATASQSVTVNPLPVNPTNGALPVMTDFATGFYGPGGIAFDGSGNLFVALSDMGSEIKKISSTGVVSTFTNSINSPYGLAFDSSGNLYVSEQYNQSIKKITSGGVVSTFASGISNPRGLAFDGPGNLYVATQTGNVYKITTDGTATIFASGLGNCAGLAFRSGFLYVSVQSDSSIKKVAAEGTFSTFVTGLSNPGHLAFDGIGNLYISENNAIKKVSPEGTVSSFLSGLNTVQGLAVDASGFMYAANNNQKVSKITFPAANTSSVDGSESVALTASPSVGETVDWYDAATGGNILVSGSSIYTTPVITSTTTYYAASRNITTGCISATRTAITVNIAQTGLSRYGSLVTDKTLVLNKNGKFGDSGISPNGQILLYRPALGATVSVSSIGANTAASGGTITSTGGSAILTRGVCWSLSANPTIVNSKTVDANSLSFSSSITGLASGTTYYVRAYATNASGTSYGTEVSFTTL